MKKSDYESCEYIEINDEWEPKIHEFNPLKAKVKSDTLGGSLTKIRGVGGSMTKTYIQPGWRVNDILLAAKILRKVQPFPSFSNEAEMRRVFGLVYDVLRYKKIFDRALKDIGFWRCNSEIKSRERIVWLLLYDMQGRKFALHDEIDDVEERKRIFEAAGLADIDDALMKVKTHLAASISRLRIRSSALTLDELLPSALRMIDGVAWGEETTSASGWVNTIKFLSKEQFLEEMSKLKLVYREDVNVTMELEETSFAFDSICPKIIHLHEKARETLAASNLVRDHRFVFLERSLCIGAAALAKAIRVGRFCGPVVLTHCLAPRHTGYLAQLLNEIEYAGRLLAFGSGDQRCEYETYLRDLGVTLQRCRVFSEKYVSHPATGELEEATVILVVPPCSYTGVKDIVDLAVARGGDTNILESLTNAYTSDDDRNDYQHLQTLLGDQMSTLRHALTMPNVQLIIYEVHTILPSETTEMVQRVVDFVNRTAIEKYISKHPNKISKEVKESLQMEEINSSWQHDTVPDSDLFELASIDDIYGKDVSHMLNPGCFLAVIRRKEVMRFNSSLFMNKAAESKSLFGGSSEERQRAKEQLIVNQCPTRASQTSVRKQVKRIKIEIDRIMAHTYSSLSRSTRENRICLRHQRYNRRQDTLRSITQVSANFNIEENSAEVVKDRNENANYLNAFVGVATPRRKDLRAIYSLFSTNTSSSTQSDASMLQNETLNVPNTFIHEKSLICDEWRQTGSSSTILKSPIMIRALQRVPFENYTENRDEESVYARLVEIRRQRPAYRRTSRLLHPGGSPANTLDLLSNTL